MSSTPPTPNDLTRQQLDELDALLQRMLTLPVPAPEPGPAPAAPAPSAWRMDPPAPMRRPFVTEEVPTREPEPVLAAAPAVFVPVSHAAAPEPFRPFPTVSLAASFPAPTVELDPPEMPPTPVTLRGVDAPALPAGFRTEPVPEPAPEPEPVALVEAAPPPDETEPRPRVPLLLWPLFALNWVIETLLGLFGPLGAVLTNPVTKHVLGVLGVLLLAAAGAWAARGMGWVHFPIPR
jgi:hypothetical protein